jgi:hypothetical protein
MWAGQVSKVRGLALVTLGAVVRFQVRASTAATLGAGLAVGEEVTKPPAFGTLPEPGFINPAFGGDGGGEHEELGAKGFLKDWAIRVLEGEGDRGFHAGDLLRGADPGRVLSDLELGDEGHLLKGGEKVIAGENGTGGVFTGENTSKHELGPTSIPGYGDVGTEVQGITDGGEMGRYEVRTSWRREGDDEVAGRVPVSTQDTEPACGGDQLERIVNLLG